MKNSHHSKPIVSESFSTPNGEPEDHIYCELLLRVGRNRDKEAFHELYDHFEHAIFNLAIYLTRDKESAFDVVQEVMLAIWKAAPAFEPGPAKGWIYRIASRKCLSYNRKRKNAAMAISRLRMASPPDESADASATAEHRDLLNSLQKEVRLLGLDDRRFITLYFWAGLSQHEIAEQMAVSQRTVSTRIENAVQKLRSVFATTRKGAITPALFGKLLGEALQTGTTAPTGMRELVLKNVNQSIQAEATRGSWSLSSIQALRYLLLPILIAAGVSLGVVCQKPDSSTTGLSNATREPVIQAVESIKADDHILYDWDFRKSPLEGFKIHSGKWRWVSNREKKYSGMFADGTSVVVVLPMPRPDGDFAIEIDVVNEHGATNIGTVACAQTKRIKCTQHLIKLSSLFSKVTNIHVGRNVYGYNGTERELIVYHKSISGLGDKLILGLKNIVLTRVRVRRLTPAELTSVSYWKEHAVDILKTRPGYVKSNFYTAILGADFK